ncbi:MAG: Crp/Fnr family transcriptional regulator [Burkholderiaceae bacterium]|nr:Crp/Fnr family transcriptional regulator [Burkholderiaceae bacterium]MCD8516107.1 Crp/Fnr family transcriptional regulator [Burkholderiaceae bacterium]MCD8536051.1 Crp/Fnr family transcriptional regulator [Burkholderiaceae bacterium]
MTTRLNNSKTDALERIRLFSGLNDLASRFLANAAQMASLKRNEYLVRRDGPADCFFVVVQGRVEVSLSADSGFHKVVEIAGPGDQIGEAMMFCGGNHLIDARAITSVNYLWLSKEDCLQAIVLDPTFAVKLLEAMSGRFVTLLADIKATNCLSARERIYQFLLTEPREGNWVRLSVTKGTIASMLGIAKETLSRELQRLSSDGLIRVEGSRIELFDPPAAARPCPNLKRGLES